MGSGAICASRSPQTRRNGLTGSRPPPAAVRDIDRATTAFPTVVRFEALPPGRYAAAGRRARMAVILK